MNWIMSLVNWTTPQVVEALQAVQASGTIPQGVDDRITPRVMPQVSNTIEAKNVNITGEIFTQNNTVGGKHDFNS